MSGKTERAERKRQRLETTYWHGGPDGIATGTTLRPITEMLGISETSRFAGSQFADIDHGYVYGTTDRSLARDYAARWDMKAAAGTVLSLMGSERLPAHNPWKRVNRLQGGTLYRIAAIGDSFPDPDYPEVGFRFRSARVVAVEEVDIPYSTKPAPETLHYILRDTGERVYDEDGFALVPAKGRELGITDEDLRPLGYAPDPMAIELHVRNLLRGL